MRSFSEYIREKASKVSVGEVKQREKVLLYMADAADKSIDNNEEFGGSEESKAIRREAGVPADFEYCCRHFAADWLQGDRHKRKLAGRANPEGYQRKFRTRADVLSIPEFKHDHYDSSQFIYLADKYVIADIAGKAFGETLRDLCAAIHETGETKKLLLRSENHAMSVVVQFKRDPERYIVKFYDPNKTVVHMRAVCDGLDGVADLSLSDFLDEHEEIPSYFDNFQHVVISDYQSVKISDLKSAESPREMTVKLDPDLSNKQKATKIAEALHSMSTSGGHGFSHYLNELLLCVDGGDVDGDFIVGQLSRGTGPESVLPVVLMYGMATVAEIEVMVNTILNTDKLNSNQKMALLNGKCGALSGFSILFEDKRSEVLSVILPLVLNSDQLSADQKVELLTDEELFEVSSHLKISLQSDDLETYLQLTSLVLGCDSLSKDQKLKIVFDKDISEIVDEKLMTADPATFIALVSTFLNPDGCSKAALLERASHFVDALEASLRPEPVRLTLFADNPGNPFQETIETLRKLIADQLGVESTGSYNADFSNTVAEHLYVLKASLFDSSLEPQMKRLNSIMVCDIFRQACHDRPLAAAGQGRAALAR